MGLALPNRTIVSLVLLFGSVLSAQAQLAVPPCKAITALPAIINASGIWCLQKDLAWAGTTGNAIDVQAAAVTLDLNGFTITGSLVATTQAVGIRSLGRRNVIVRNGTIRGFLTAVSIEGAGSINDVIENLHVDQAKHDGIRIKSATGTIVRNNQITAISGTVNENNFGVEVDAAKNTTISNNSINGVAATGHANGVGLTNADLTEVRDNSILNVVLISTTGGGTGLQINGVASVTSTNTAIQSNRILNGANQGGDGILGSGGSGVNCINNVIQHYSTPIAGCSIDSGNVAAP